MLAVRIEVERAALHQCAAEFGLGDKRTIEQSQRLDRLLVVAQRARMRRGVA